MIVGAVIRKPRLWRTALRQYVRMIPPKWWARKPFLPIPSKQYLDFRMETQYGFDGTPNKQDVVDYLEWCRRQESATTSS